MFLAGWRRVPFRPCPGWIGTYVTGSDTSANILFSNLQSSCRHQIGVGSSVGVDPMRALLAGSGAAGGVVGKMISPQSLTIAATAIGLAGGESVILRKVLVLAAPAGPHVPHRRPHVHPLLSWMLPVSITLSATRHQEVHHQ